MHTALRAAASQVDAASTPANQMLGAGGLRTLVVTACSPIGGTIKPTRFHDEHTALHIGHMLQRAGFDVAVRHAEEEACDASDTGGERHE